MHRVIRGCPVIRTNYTPLYVLVNEISSARTKGNTGSGLRPAMQIKLENPRAQTALVHSRQRRKNHENNHPPSPRIGGGWREEEGLVETGCTLNSAIIEWPLCAKRHGRAD